MKYFLLFIFLFPFLLPAQNQVIDSLKLALKNAKHDTTRCYILSLMVESESDDNVWPVYNEQMLELSQKNISISSDPSLKKIYLKYNSNAMNNVCYLYSIRGDILYK